MKRTLASFFMFALAASPAIALADSLAPAQTLAQYTAALAQVEAQEKALSSDQSLVCAAAVSKSTVSVGEPFAIGWGSVGAMEPSSDTARPMWAPQGSSMIALDEPGTWTYYFTFYAQNGASIQCAAKIVVVPAAQ